MTNSAAESMTVEDQTKLSSLLSENMGVCDWAASQAFRR